MLNPNAVHEGVQLHSNYVFIDTNSAKNEQQPAIIWCNDQQ